jgi:hypothetical protein
MTEEGAAHLVGELREIERRRLAALIHADTAEATALHAEDYQLITPGGASLSKDEYLGQIADGALAYRQFEPDGDIAVLILGPSAAALRYQVTIEAAFPGGHDVDRFWHTDIYERRDGRWQAVWSQATRIGKR